MISLAQNSDESEPVTDDAQVAQEYAELLNWMPAGSFGVTDEMLSAAAWWEGCEELP